MKKKFSKILGIGLTLALLASLLMIAAPVTAYSYTDYTNAITKTADRLVALQGTDGGWDWVVTDLTAHSGIYPSPANLFGVTALGLIDAYEVTGDEAYKTAAQVTADHLLTLDRSIDPAVRIQSFDYRFLVECSVLLEDPSYEAHAIDQWSVAKIASDFHYGDGNQENIWDFWVDVGGEGFAAWSASDMGLAALAMGDTSWAANMASVLEGHLNEITGDDIYRFIGGGRALEFLNEVNPVVYSTSITNIIVGLTTSQNGDGSWGSGENSEGYTQDVAYAIMGLAAVGEGSATRAGADWLVTNQDYGSIEGGWNNSTNSIEYSESDSEALQAVKAVLDISSSVDMTATSPGEIIGISVTPSSVNFGSLVPGQVSATQTVTVTNIGNVAVDIDASIVNESVTDFYTTNLTIAVPGVAGPVNAWAAPNIPPESGNTVVPELVLDMPSGTPAGTYTATLVFWAELTQ